MTAPTPLDVDRVEEVSEEHLGGASLYEVAVFRTAVMEYQLAEGAAEAQALAVVWNAGDWRGFLARRRPDEWSRIQRHLAVDALVPEGEEPLSKEERLVLESLERGPKHGAAVALEVEQRTGTHLDRETLQAAVYRLVDLGLVARTTDTQTTHGPRKTWTVAQPPR